MLLSMTHLKGNCLQNYINIGIATNTDLGLFVPNIKDANTKSMFGIADR